MKTVKHINLKCINCEEMNFVYKFSGRDRLHDLPGKFDVYECKTCGMFALNPQLSRIEAQKFYPDNYVCYSEAIEDEKNFLKRIDRLWGSKRRCRVVERKVNQRGKLLDIGSASGIFLGGMQKLGWDCYGVETNLKAAKYAKERFGLKVYNGTVTEALHPANFFDVVTLWDVLEHLVDPCEVLVEVDRILKPGGFLFISVPNSSAWDRYLFGDYWIGWDIPRHNWVFNDKNLKAIIEKLGFENISLFSFSGRHGALKLSFGFWLTETRLSILLRSILKAIVNSFLCRIMLLPLVLIAERKNRSTNVCLYAQKVKVTS